jgi:hypothetical protein
MPFAKLCFVWKQKKKEKKLIYQKKLIYRKKTNNQGRGGIFVLTKPGLSGIIWSPMVPSADTNEMCTLLVLPNTNTIGNSSFDT